MPLTKAEPKLTSDIIFAHLDEAEIWYAYFGPFELGQITHSVFREDKHPSTGFYLSKSGRIIYNDLATSEKLDCFAFVAKKNNITYGQAVRQVACDFGIIPCGEKPKFQKGQLDKARIAAAHLKRHTEIEFIPEKWNNSNLKYWEQRFINQDELVDEDVFSVKKVFVNGRLAPNYSKQQRYAYVINIGGKSYKKIYTPYASQKDFKWITNIPLKIPFGINKLTHKTKTLLIAKAQKDRILFRKFLPDVIAPQNESPAALNDKTRKFIAENYDNVIICFDPDAAGLNAVAHYSALGYSPLFIPEKVQAKGLKDFDDFVLKYGLGWFEKYLKLKGLI